MASACVNSIGIDCPPPSPPNNFTSFSWLTPKKISCHLPESLNPVDKEEQVSDPFEFQLDEVRMLPADELFSDGKLVPLQLSVQQQQPPEMMSEVTTPKISPPGPGGYLFSPRAPTCSSRWKELLGFKRFYHNNNNNNNNSNYNKQHLLAKTTPAASASASASHKSLKSFLHRTPKSSVSPHVDSSSLTLPLIQDAADSDSFSILSSRLSLSSSCSSSGGHDHDDFPRHSLDSENPKFRRTSKFSHCHNRSRQLQGVPKEKEKEKSLLSSENPDSIRTSRSNLRKDAELISADSPRMNSSGKIVFHHSLERSSSSPSTLNGGPRYKYRGMERSYSANVRYTPVLNVPVCSLRGSSSSSTTSSKSSGVFGFPTLFSPSSSSSAASGDRKNRSDRA